MKRRDDRDQEVEPIARQIEQLARAPKYAPRGYRIGDYGNRVSLRWQLRRPTNDEGDQISSFHGHVRWNERFVTILGHI